MENIIEAQDTNKTLQIHFRCSPEEKKGIDRNYLRFSTGKKTTLSKFLIEAGLKYYQKNTEKNKKPEILDMLIKIETVKYEINKIGVNINQAAKKINSFDKYSIKIDREKGVLISELQNLEKQILTLDEYRGMLLGLYEKL